MRKLHMCKLFALFGLLSILSPLFAQTTRSEKHGIYTIDISYDEASLSSGEFTLSLSAAEATTIKLNNLHSGPGLEFSGSATSTSYDSVRQKNIPKLTLSFKTQASSRYSIDSLKITVDNSEINLAPLTFTARNTRPTNSNSTQGQATLWTIPSTIYRYESIVIQAPSGAKITGLTVPRDMTFEAIPGGNSFIMTSLASGSIALPHSSEQITQNIIVQEEPASISATKAIGDFSLSLETTSYTITAGESLALRLILKGSGNLPFVQKPILEYSLDNKNYLALDESAILLNNVGSSQIALSPLGYQGQRLWQYTIKTSQVSKLHIRSKAYPYLKSDHSFALLPTQDIAINVLPAEKQSIQVTQSKTTIESVTSITSLASEYHKMRFALNYFAALNSQKEHAKKFNHPLPLHDITPSPSLFATVTIIVMLGSLALFILYRQSKKRASLSQHFLGVSSLTLASLSAILLILFFLSLAERRTSYALITVPNARALPTDSSPNEQVIHLETGSIISQYGELYSIRLEDGKIIWLSATDFIRY